MIGTLFVGTFALLVASYALSVGIPFTSFTETITLALQVSLVLGIVNVTIKPLLKVLTIPFHLLSLGFFSFIINGLLILLTSKIVPGFTIPSFLQAIYFAAIVSIIMRVYHFMASDTK